MLSKLKKVIVFIGGYFYQTKKTWQGSSKEDYNIFQNITISRQLLNLSNSLHSFSYTLMDKKRNLDKTQYTHSVNRNENQRKDSPMQSGNESFHVWRSVHFKTRLWTAVSGNTSVKDGSQMNFATSSLLSKSRTFGGVSGVRQPTAETEIDQTVECLFPTDILIWENIILRVEIQ